MFDGQAVVLRRSVNLQSDLLPRSHSGSPEQDTSKAMASAFSKDVKAAREVASEVLASMSSHSETGAKDTQSVAIMPKAARLVLPRPHALGSPPPVLFLAPGKRGGGAASGHVTEAGWGDSRWACAKRWRDGAAIARPAAGSSRESHG